MELQISCKICTFLKSVTNLKEIDNLSASIINRVGEYCNKNVFRVLYRLNT